MPSLKVINKRARLVEVLRNKRRGLILRAEEAPVGNFNKCKMCWMRGRDCIMYGQLCLSVAAELGLYSILFIRK